jgi:proteasome component ECM29
MARKDLEPHLPSIIPKLFRYSHDPNPKVAESMQNIWKALVPNDARHVIDQYFEVCIPLAKLRLLMYRPLFETSWLE